MRTLSDIGLLLTSLLQLARFWPCTLTETFYPLEPRHRRHSSPTHRNAGKRGTTTGPMIYPNTIMAGDQESESLEDDVYAPMMAYSVGTLDQRRGEPSHLPKSRTTCK